MFYDRLNEGGAHMHFIQVPNRFFKDIGNNGDHKSFCYGCYDRFHVNIRKDTRRDVEGRYLTFGGHTCEAFKCTRCVQVFEDVDARNAHTAFALETCANCRRQFHGRQCMERHSQGCSIALADKKCRSCKGPLGIDIVTGRCPEHCRDCFHCPRCCRDDRRKDHSCFWQRRKAPDATTPEEACEHFWVFDFESMFVEGRHVDRAISEVKKHTVNFVCARRLYSDEEKVWPDLDGFVDFLQELAHKKHKSYFIAHNMKGYDGRLLMDHVRDKLGKFPDKCTIAGSKIMSMVLFGKIVVRDSLCHIANSLAAMPKMFGLDEEQYKKGYFPYLFNTPENQSYVGTIPAIQWFEPNMMAPDKRLDFLKWYDENKNLPYDFRHELEEYCRSDVRILAHSLEVYIREGMTYNGGLNPMEEITIASYALRVYKTLYMPENTIGLISPEAQQFARRAFSGGRTDVRKMIRFWSEDDVALGKYGVYQDVQSLYPTVQVFDPMPIGHPVITKYIVAGESTQPQPAMDYLRTFFGFIECDLTPVKYMHHPIIVEKKDGKLMADLYSKQKVCQHLYTKL
jgi:hypothetical protein